MALEKGQSAVELELENGNRTGHRESDIRKKFVAQLESSLGKSR